VRLLKTLGILAAVAVSCGVGFVLLGFPVGGVAGPDAIGAEIGRMLFLFVVPAIPTSIVYWFRRNNPAVNYPGLGTGIVLALLLVSFVWVGELKHRGVVLGEGKPKTAERPYLMLVSFEGIRQLATLPAAALVAADITARGDVMA
jgi:hypothetical protein